MKVVFNVVSEFVEELREEATDPNVIAGRVVRVTVLYQGVRELPPLQSVTVVAGAVVRGTLLELRLYCGDIMPGAPEWKESAPAKQKVRETMDWLKSEAVQLQLTVRKGMYSA
jgi:hypothetical protein